MTDLPVECPICFKLYDGSQWDACPGCQINQLSVALRNARALIDQAIDYLEDDAPIHALDTLMKVPRGT